MLKLCIPLVPPSVNHYVKHTRKGKHYVTREATAFKDAVAIFWSQATCGTIKVMSKSFRYRIHITVMLGKGQRLDIDNSPKCVLDALKDCGAIHSDAAVTALSVSMGRDASNPRTEIEIEVL